MYLFSCAVYFWVKLKACKIANSGDVVKSTGYRYESWTGPLSCAAITNS